MRNKLMIFLSLVFFMCAVAIFLQTYTLNINKPLVATKSQVNKTTETRITPPNVLSAISLPQSDVMNLEVNRYSIISITDTNIMLKDLSTEEKIPYGLGQDIIITNEKGLSRKVSVLNQSYVNKEVVVLTDKKTGRNSLIIYEK